MQYYHLLQLHSGVNQTLTSFLERFWTPKARRKISQIIDKYYGCYRKRSKPFAFPVMPPLPEDRVVRHCPFKVIELDYLGPTLVKTENGTIKAWIALFTCLSTRAVPLAVVTSLSAEDFILAFRRFIARRRKPLKIISDKIISDNYFVYASKVITELHKDHGE